MALATPQPTLSRIDISGRRGGRSRGRGRKARSYAPGVIMTKVKIRHYVLKRGKGFWQPTPLMKALGFYSVPCGADGPDAWAIAERWNERWDKTKRGQEPSPAMVAVNNLSPE